MSRKRRAFVAAAALAVAGAFAAVFLLVSPFGGGGPRAVIVDQLSLTFPNPDFAREATDILEDAGYEVDYVPGEEVTVDFYRGLPERGDDLLVLRAHSARLQAEWYGQMLDEVVVFTNEPYSDQKYRREQAGAYIAIAYAHESAPRYFGVTAGFVEHGMRGGLDGATVIMMGCEGLSSVQTAEAFLARGAESYISWDNTVSATHTDAATLSLLRHMTEEGLSAQEATAAAMDDVGPDPIYDSTLSVWPDENSATGQ